MIKENIWKTLWIGLLCLFGFLYYNVALKPIAVIDFWNEPFPVDKEVYVQWDTVSYRVEYCRYITSVANVTAYLQEKGDEYRIYVKEWSNSFGKSESDCTEGNPDVIWDFWLWLPFMSRSWIYRISFVVSYDVNSLREPVEFVVNTDWFEVDVWSVKSEVEELEDVVD